MGDRGSKSDERLNLINLLKKIIFSFIILFILIGGIFLMPWLCSFYMDPFLLAAMVPIKTYSNAEADKAQILQENQKKDWYLYVNKFKKW